MAKKSAPWAMAAKDVCEGFTGSTSGGSRAGRLARTSRSDSVTSSTVFLVHHPTGIRVEATIPPGHYSRAEMISERNRLKAVLWEELERNVSTAMRLPGR